MKRSKEAEKIMGKGPEQTMSPEWNKTNERKRRKERQKHKKRPRREPAKIVEESHIEKEKCCDIGHGHINILCCYC